MTKQHALASAVTAHHASTARAIGRVSALLAHHRAHFTALHELVNRQAAVSATGGSTILARHARDVGRLHQLVSRRAAASISVAAGSTILARHARDAFAGGSIGALHSFVAGGSTAVGAAIARQHRVHASSLQNLIVGNSVSTLARAFAAGSASAAIARQHRAHASVLRLVDDHYIHIRAALATGGSMGAVRAALPGLGVGTVIRSFVPTEPVSTATPQHDSETDVPHLQRFDLVDETDAFLERTLGMLNPAFSRQLRGSTQRSIERGPDWWTQAAASERKLFLGVLHTAAPDDHVLPWVTNPKVQLDRLGHPTRRAKIAWLCRSIPNKSYREYLLTELDSALALIDLLNTAVHVDDFPQFEATFSWTQLRLKVAIRHILEIWLRWS